MRGIQVVAQAEVEVEVVADGAGIPEDIVGLDIVDEKYLKGISPQQHVL